MSKKSSDTNRVYKSITEINKEKADISGENRQKLWTDRSQVENTE